MEEILNLVETTNNNLKNQNKLAIPSNYEKEFFKLLEKSDIILEDYEDFNEIKSLLNDNEKKELSKNRITNFKELSILLIKRIPETEIKQFLRHLSFYMSPSITNKDIKFEIYDICTNIAKTPTELINIENTRKLRKITNDRIFSDKALFNEKTSDIKNLILFLHNYFNKILNNHTTTLEKINEIKKEISGINLSLTSSKELKLLQDRLFNTAEKLENSLEKSTCDINDNKQKCSSLQEEIQKLQENLSKAEEEKSIDYLTGILTRRAYVFEVERIENEYNVFDSKYALVFFDIDYFKKINDNYGHDCGDAVLTTFANILKKLTRTEDIIARYGGEEFVAIVHYKNIIEVTNYLSRAKNIITNNKFLYKDIKLNVQFSAGVTFRKNYDSYEETIKEADNLLYKAKKDGRNKIILDTGDIL